MKARALSVVVLLACAAVLIGTTAVSAVTYQIEYNNAAGYITYAATGSATTDSLYVSAMSSGAVTLIPANPVDLGIANGVNDKDSVAVMCGGFVGDTVTILMQSKSSNELVYSGTFRFQCSGGGAPTLLPAPAVPTLSEWGLVILVIMLMASASWVLWRRRSASTT